MNANVKVNLAVEVRESENMNKDLSFWLSLRIANLRTNK